MLEMLMGPGHFIPTSTATVVLVGMVALALADAWRQEVEDWATASLLLVAVAGLLTEGLPPVQWLGAALSAAAVFSLYLLLGMQGVMGGGDVKLSVVPGLVLGAIHPLLGLWWVAASIATQQMLIKVVAPRVAVAGGRRRTHPVTLPHVPAMAVAMCAALVVFAR